MTYRKSPALLHSLPSQHRILLFRSPRSPSFSPSFFRGGGGGFRTPSFLVTNRTRITKGRSAGFVTLGTICTHGMFEGWHRHKVPRRCPYQRHKWRTWRRGWVNVVLSETGVIYAYVVDPSPLRERPEMAPDLGSFFVPLLFPGRGYLREIFPESSFYRLCPTANGERGHVPIKRVNLRRYGCRVRLSAPVHRTSPLTDSTIIYLLLDLN